MNRKSYLNWTVRSSEEPTLAYYIPIKTAAWIKFTDMHNVEYSFFSEVFKDNRWSSRMIVNMNHKIPVSRITEIYKLSTKNNAKISITASPQQKIFQDLFYKFSEYRIKFERYHNAGQVALVPQKRKNSERVEVSADSHKRIKLYKSGANMLMQNTALLTSPVAITNNKL